MPSTRTPAWSVLLVAAVFALASCATGDDSGDDPGDDPGGDASGAAGTLTTVRVALDYVPNTNHIGMYVADQLGYYEAEGIDIEVLPYAETFPEVLLGSGDAEFGFSYQAGIAYSRAGGSDIQQVFANIARSQYAIGYVADSGITRPRDLDGLTYAGFGTPDEGPALSSVIRADGGTGEFTSIALGTTAYDAVYAGQADFTFSVRTWDGVQAVLLDKPMSYFEFTDYGFPRQYSSAIAASQSWLTDNEDTARGFLAATQRGYEFARDNPADAAAELLAAEPDAFKDPELVTISAQLLSDDGYYQDPDSTLGVVDPEVWRAYGSFLFDNGLLTDAAGDAVTDEPDWSQYYSNDYLP